MHVLQEEVALLAQKEMAEHGPPGISSASLATPGSSSSSSAPKQEDLQTVVDELRSEIAAVRAILQQIKNSSPGIKTK